MRQHRLLFLIRQLLAEQHVYVRSGPAGRYVVLGWPWQVGVSLATLGFVAWTGLASYGWVAAHLELREQRRELAQLAQINQRLDAVAEVPAPAAGLVAELDEVKAGGRQAPGAPAAFDGKAHAAVDAWKTDMVDGWLAQRLLPAALQFDGSTSGRDWLYDRLARHRGDASARAAEAMRLRAELGAARAEIARLRSGLDGEAAEADR